METGVPGPSCLSGADSPLAGRVSASGDAGAAGAWRLAGLVHNGVERVQDGAQLRAGTRSLGGGALASPGPAQVTLHRRQRATQPHGQRLQAVIRVLRPQPEYFFVADGPAGAARPGQLVEVVRLNLDV